MYDATSPTARKLQVEVVTETSQDVETIVICSSTDQLVPTAMAALQLHQQQQMQMFQRKNGKKVGAAAATFLLKEGKQQQGTNNSSLAQTALRPKDIDGPHTCAPVTPFDEERFHHFIQQQCTVNKHYHEANKSPRSATNDRLTSSTRKRFVAVLTDYMTQAQREALSAEIRQRIHSKTGSNDKRVLSLSFFTKNPDANARGREYLRAAVPNVADIMSITQQQQEYLSRCRNPYNYNRAEQQLEEAVAARQDQFRERLEAALDGVGTVGSFEMRCNVGANVNNSDAKKKDGSGPSATTTSRGGVAPPSPALQQQSATPRNGNNDTSDSDDDFNIPTSIAMNPTFIRAINGVGGGGGGRNKRRGGRGGGATMQSSIASVDNGGLNNQQQNGNLTPRSQQKGITLVTREGFLADMQLGSEPGSNDGCRNPMTFGNGSTITISPRSLRGVGGGGGTTSFNNASRTSHHSAQHLVRLNNVHDPSTDLQHKLNKASTLYAKEVAKASIAIVAEDMRKRGLVDGGLGDSSTTAGNNGGDPQQQQQQKGASDSVPAGAFRGRSDSILGGLTTLPANHQQFMPTLVDPNQALVMGGIAAFTKGRFDKRTGHYTGAFNSGNQSIFSNAEGADHSATARKRSTFARGSATAGKGSSDPSVEGAATNAAMANANEAKNQQQQGKGTTISPKDMKNGDKSVTINAPAGGGNGAGGANPRHAKFLISRTPFASVSAGGAPLASSHSTNILANAYLFETLFEQVNGVGSLAPPSHDTTDDKEDPNEVVIGGSGSGYGNAFTGAQGGGVAVGGVGLVSGTKLAGGSAIVGKGATVTVAPSASSVKALTKSALVMGANAVMGSGNGSTSGGAFKPAVCVLSDVRYPLTARSKKALLYRLLDCYGASVIGASLKNAYDLAMTLESNAMGIRMGMGIGGSGAAALSNVNTIIVNLSLTEFLSAMITPYPVTIDRALRTRAVTTSGAGGAGSAATPQSPRNHSSSGNNGSVSANRPRSWLHPEPATDTLSSAVLRLSPRKAELITSKIDKFALITPSEVPKPVTSRIGTSQDPLAAYAAANGGAVESHKPLTSATISPRRLREERMREEEEAKMSPLQKHLKKLIREGGGNGNVGDVNTAMIPKPPTTGSNTVGGGGGGSVPIASAAATPHSRSMDRPFPQPPLSSTVASNYSLNGTTGTLSGDGNGNFPLSGHLNRRSDSFSGQSPRMAIPYSSSYPDHALSTIIAKPGSSNMGSQQQGRRRSVTSTIDGPNSNINTASNNNNGPAPIMPNRNGQFDADVVAVVRPIDQFFMTYDPDLTGMIKRDGFVLALIAAAAALHDSNAVADKTHGITPNSGRGRGGGGSNSPSRGNSPINSPNTNGLAMMMPPRDAFGGGGTPSNAALAFMQGGNGNANVYRRDAKSAIYYTTVWIISLLFQQPATAEDIKLGELFALRDCLRHVVLREERLLTADKALARLNKTLQLLAPSKGGNSDDATKQITANGVGANNLLTDGAAVFSTAVDPFVVANTNNKGGASTNTSEDIPPMSPISAIRAAVGLGKNNKAADTTKATATTIPAASSAAATTIVSLATTCKPLLCLDRAADHGIETHQMVSYGELAIALAEALREL